MARAFDLSGIAAVESAGGGNHQRQVCCKNKRKHDTGWL